MVDKEKELEKIEGVTKGPKAQTIEETLRAELIEVKNLNKKLKEQLAPFIQPINPITANIYQKLAIARQMFHTQGFGKGGNVNFGNTHYSYFRLEEIIPLVESISKTLRIVMPISFGKEIATLKFLSIDDPTDCIEFESPISLSAIKGGSVVQNIGAMQTYIRRYLYILVFDIIEQDAVEDNNARPAPVEYINKQQAGALWGRIKQAGLEDACSIVLKQSNMNGLSEIISGSEENFFNECVRVSNLPEQ